MIRKVYEVDSMVCPQCGGVMAVAITAGIMLMKRCLIMQAPDDSFFTFGGRARHAA